MTYSPECVAAFEAKFPPPNHIEFLRSGRIGGYVLKKDAKIYVDDKPLLDVFLQDKMLAAFAANWELVKESEAAANSLARLLEAINSGQTATVLYDLSPAMAESEVRDKLIALGWKPPELLEKGNE